MLGDMLVYQSVFVNLHFPRTGIPEWEETQHPQTERSEWLFGQRQMTTSRMGDALFVKVKLAPLKPRALLNEGVFKQRSIHKMNRSFRLHLRFCLVWRSQVLNWNTWVWFSTLTWQVMKLNCPMFGSFIQWYRVIGNPQGITFNCF